MTLRVFTGLPATGKTSTIIKEAQLRQNKGDHVVLFLSSEHEELTRRPNVRPGGLMGCRVQGVNFKIDHVVDTGEANSILSSLKSGALVIFDEAQYFKPEIVDAWQNANQNGVDVLVGTPSASQLKALSRVNHALVKFEVDCSCKNRRATKVIYENDLVYPNHLCEKCYKENMKEQLDTLLADVKEASPFPGEFHTYQPFFDVPMKGWKLVRGDSPQRLEIIRRAITRSSVVKDLLQDPVSQPTFIDLGCCSGFFSDGMTSMGFRSSGVDVDKNFINWGNRLARIKGQSINYDQLDLLEYLNGSEADFDVISTFATVQWVMDQRGYEAGIDCFKRIFAKTRAVCIVEMGYTTEDIYKDKISDRPEEIDRDWVLKIMADLGDFAEIEVHPAGEDGIWRDIFVGFKEVPTPEPFPGKIPVDGCRQISGPVGHWSDDWVAQSFEIYLETLDPTESFVLEGWRPEGSPTAEISVAVAGTNLPSQRVSDGIFKVEHKLELASGSLFRLSITSNVPVGAPGDDRELAFVLRSLSFN